jgi:hypothetical protein
MRRETGIMSLPRETLLLSRGKDPAIRDQGSSTVVVIS